MPFKYYRESYSQSLIKETKERVKDEISNMSLDELKEHLEYLKHSHETAILCGDDDSKVLYHELKVVRAEYKKQFNLQNAKLAKMYLKLQESHKVKCPKCGERFSLK